MTRILIVALLILTTSTSPIFAQTSRSDQSERRIYKRPARPPAAGEVTMQCHLTTLEGATLSAEVGLDYNKDHIAPHVEIKSADPSLVASMPLTPAIAKSGTLKRYANYHLPDGNWQVIEYETAFDISDRSIIKIFKQGVAATENGEEFNSLFAVGICRLQYGIEK